MKSHYVMQNVFAGHAVLKKSGGYSSQAEFQNYLSQTLLTYLSEEFLKIL